MFRVVRVEGVAVEADHPIATCLLGHIKRVVCRTNQRFTIGDPRVGPT
jgi:hypothetical protein